MKNRRPLPRVPKPVDPAPDKPRMPTIFQVVVQCRDERDQEEVYRRMKAEGRKCRVLTL